MKRGSTNGGEVKQYLSPDEVATRVGVNAYTVRRWLREGRLRGVKITARMWRISEADLAAFLRQGDAQGQ